MPLQTRILRIDTEAVEQDKLVLISDILQSEGVMVYPTETFYGLGALAFSEKAVRKVYRLKKRERGKPLSVVISDFAMAESIACSVVPLFRTLASEFWPGPLTLVIKARPIFPPQMLGPGGSLAMRIPKAVWLRELIRRLGIPITATSANISGEEEISRSEEVLRVFRRKTDLIVDGGPTPGGWPTTIVDLTSDEPRLLRTGAVPVSRLQKYL